MVLAFLNFSPVIKKFIDTSKKSYCIKIKIFAETFFKRLTTLVRGAKISIKENGKLVFTFYQFTLKSAN